MRYFLLSLFSIICLYASSAQSHFGLSRDFKKIDIPFDYKNNLMIIEIIFNRTFPLKFIFDTGAETTILAKKEITDLLRIPYEREFSVLGSDLKTELTAYLVRGIHIRTGDMVIPYHSMLVLKEDYLRFEEMTGLEIHGILGADAFRGLVVRINYERKLITLLKRESFEPPRGFTAIPIEVYRGKAYLHTDLNIQPDSTNRVKLLLDSGSMMPLLINSDTDSDLHLPQNVLSGTIGAGLGGFIDGYIGRVSSLSIGPYNSNEVLTNFQELNEVIDSSILNGRNGIIGNPLLRRFHVVIDYPKETLYLKPNRRYKESFEFDKSGLVVIAADTRLNSYIIHYVIPGSPADEAGLMAGDRIIRINCLPPSFFSLPNIHKLLRKKEGKKIRIAIRRNGEKLKFCFRLRKLI